jgi:hypothetical protein
MILSGHDSVDFFLPFPVDSAGPQKEVKFHFLLSVGG